MTSLLEAIPVRVILNDQTGLLGARPVCEYARGIVGQRHPRIRKSPSATTRTISIIATNTFAGRRSSFLSALLGSVAPIMVPFFLAFGLVKGAYIGTKALSTVIMHVTNLVAYRRTSVLTDSGVLIGLALGPIMFLAHSSAN